MSQVAISGGNTSTSVPVGSGSSSYSGVGFTNTVTPVQVFKGREGYGDYPEYLMDGPEFLAEHLADDAHALTAAHRGADPEILIGSGIHPSAVFPSGLPVRHTWKPVCTDNTTATGSRVF